MYKKILLMIGIILLSFSISFVRVELIDTSEKSILLATKYNDADEKKQCTGLFGDPEDEDSFAYLLQYAFTIMKFAGPILCIAFSIVDFVKAVVSDKKDELARVVKRSLTRVVLALVLFFIPIIVDFLFPLLGFYGTCGIK